jgi:thiol-disulfide isomerase/thioredoxin
VTHRLLAGFLLLAAGCVPAPAGRPATLTPPADSPPVTLKETSVAGFANSLAELKGKVVLVDAWFLGCHPCVEKFPKTVALHEKYKGEGFTAVGLDIMRSELEKKDRVLKFLEEKKAAFPNYIFNDTEAAIDAWMERMKAYPTPAMILYDRNGEYVKTLTEATHEEIEAAVREQLAKK